MTKLTEPTNKTNVAGNMKTEGWVRKGGEASWSQVISLVRCLIEVCVCVCVRVHAHTHVCMQVPCLHGSSGSIGEVRFILDCG